jgi:glycosyltransferase involved in cell wall biosynthesis
MISKPVVSVVMPCYQHVKFVGETIISVLNQTFADFELIIIDDASTDGSLETIRKYAGSDYRVNLIEHEENLGVSHSRNEGIHRSRGEFIAFCDADDVWKRQKLELQLQLLRSNPGYGLTYCDAEIIDPSGQPTGKLFSQVYPAPKNAVGDMFKGLCRTNFINTQTVLMRRECFDPDIFFDESMRSLEDWWLWLRLAGKHRFLPDTRVLAQYRTHPKNTSLTQARDFARVRFKIARRNLTGEPNLPINLRAVLWYQMSTSLGFLGKRRLTAKFLFHTLSIAIRDTASLRQVLGCLKRLVLLYAKGASSPALGYDE